MSTTTDATPELTYELIQQAVKGDPAALEMILKHYEPYHNALAAYETVDVDGIVRREIDEDIKVQIQQRLVYAIQHKWRKLIE